MRQRVALALVCAILSISFAAILFKLAPGMDPATAAGSRLVIAGLVTMPFWLGQRPRLATLAWAGLAYGVHFGTWVASLGLVSVALSVTAVTTTPVLLATAGLVTRRDAPDKRVLVSLLLGVAGLSLMAADAPSNASERTWLGLGLALIGAIAMAAYLLVVRRATLERPSHPLAISGGAAMVGGVLLLLVAGLGGARVLPSSLEEALVVLGAAAVPQLIGHGLMTWAIRHSSPTEVALSTLGEPIGAALLAAVVLDESLSPMTVGGGVITLGAVVLALTRPVGPVSAQ